MQARELPLGPSEVTSFVEGRHYLPEIAEAFGRGRLVTLHGPFGVGKTRLALRYLRTQEAQSECLVLAAGGLTQAEFTQRVQERAQTIDQVASAAGVLLLDGVDQNDPSLVRVVSDWMAAYPPLRLLVTSRRQLRLQGEQVVRVAPLDADTPDENGLSAAAKLFIQRRAATGVGEIVTDSPRVAELVRRLHGLPLLIELVAERSTVLGVDDVLARPESLLDLLVTRAQDRDVRQRSVRDVLDGICAPLSAEQRLVLWQAAVFSETFTLQSLEEVLDGLCSFCHEALQELVECSLVQPAPASPDFPPTNAPEDRQVAEPTATAPRFIVLNPVRLYALETARAAGTLTVARRRHGDWLWERLASAQSSPVPYLQLLPELSDLEQALSSPSDRTPAQLIEIARVLLSAFAVRGDRHDVARVEGALLSALQLGARTSNSSVVGSGAEYQHLLEEGQVEASALLDVLLQFASARLRHGETRRAAELLDVAKPIIDRASGARHAILTHQRLMAGIARALGDATGARQAFELALSLTDDPATPAQERAAVLSQYAGWLYEQGATEESERRYAEALRVHKQSPRGHVEAVTLNNFALIVQEAGEFERAEKMLESSLALHREAGNRRFEAIALSDLGVLALEQGQSLRAARLCGAASRRLKALGSERLALLAGSFSAVALALGGNPEEARRLVRVVLTAPVAESGEKLSRALASAALVNAEMASWIAEQGIGPAAPLWVEPPARDESSVVWNGETEKFGTYCDEVRLARRIARCCHTWCVSQSGCLVVTRECTSGRTPNGEPIDFSDKPVLARLLRALLEHRLEGVREALTPSQLWSAAWPGEKMTEAAAKNRLHVALSKLRKAGLQGEICTDRGTYRLSPTLPTRVISALT